MGGTLAKAIPRRRVVVSQRQSRYSEPDGPLLIAICGKKRTGKDSLAVSIEQVFLSKKKLLRTVALADPLKDLVALTLGKPRGFIDYWKDVDEVPPGMQMSMRSALQKVGQLFRDIRSDVWISRLISELDGDTVVTDVRHKNELESLEKLGAFGILIIRDVVHDDPHPSETEFDDAIEWCRANLQTPVESSTATRHTISHKDGMPDSLKYVHYVIFNNGSLHDLDRVATDIITEIVHESYDEKVFSQSDEMGI